MKKYLLGTIITLSFLGIFNFTHATGINNIQRLHEIATSTHSGGNWCRYYTDTTNDGITNSATEYNGLTDANGYSYNRLSAISVTVPFLTDHHADCLASARNATYQLPTPIPASTDYTYKFYFITGNSSGGSATNDVSIVEWADHNGTLQTCNPNQDIETYTFGGETYYLIEAICPLIDTDNEGYLHRIRFGATIQSIDLYNIFYTASTTDLIHEINSASDLREFMDEEHAYQGFGPQLLPDTYLFINDPRPKATSTSPLYFQFQYRFDTTDFAAGSTYTIKQSFFPIAGDAIFGTDGLTHFATSTSGFSLTIEDPVFFDEHIIYSDYLDLDDGYYYMRIWIEDQNGIVVNQLEATTEFGIGLVGATVSEILAEARAEEIANEKCDFTGSWIGALTTEGLCKVFVYLFYPQDTLLDKFTEYSKMTQRQIPFVYFVDTSTLIGEFLNMGTSTASSTLFFDIRGTKFTFDIFPFASSSERYPEAIDWTRSFISTFLWIVNIITIATMIFRFI